jgi:hypothetical protein
MASSLNMRQSLGKVQMQTSISTREPVPQTGSLVFASNPRSYNIEMTDLESKMPTQQNGLPVRTSAAVRRVGAHPVLVADPPSQSLGPGVRVIRVGVIGVTASRHAEYMEDVANFIYIFRGHLLPYIPRLSLR